MENVITADRLTKWLATIATPLHQLATKHASLYASMRPALSRAYAEAGYPYGRDDDDMLAWWQEQATVERARWAGKISAQATLPGRPAKGRARAG